MHSWSCSCRLETLVRRQLPALLDMFNTCVASLSWNVVLVPATWQQQAVYGVLTRQLKVGAAQLQTQLYLLQPSVRMVLVLQLEEKAMAAERALAAEGGSALSTAHHNALGKCFPNACRGQVASNTCC